MIRHGLLVVAWLLTAWTGKVDAESPRGDRLVRDEYGAIVRGDVSSRQLALVFTGDEMGESTGPIVDALRERKIKAAFFVTGNFLRQPALRPLLKRAIAEGHYVGPHSDAHPLYCSWEDRDKSLVTQKFFTADLSKNMAGLRTLGALRESEPVYFIPPYEWHNRDQVRWSRALGVTLINFTPGSGSNRDYAPEGDRALCRHAPSTAISWHTNRKTRTA
jgi:peptidoglycan/xylan/chitin deacetylase (PgdA/CDA1 family)